MSSWWPESTAVHVCIQHMVYSEELSDEKLCLCVKDLINVQTDVPHISVNTVFVGLLENFSHIFHEKLEGHLVVVPESKHVLCRHFPES